MAHDSSTEQLVKKVRVRKEFLDKIINSITELVREYGRVTRREQGSSHTRVVMELRNFGNFTFETDLGQTMFGGNAVRVWHHPGKSFREGGLDAAWDKEWKPVLDVYFQTDYQVGAFDEETDWQKALIYVLKNQRRVARENRDAVLKRSQKLEKKERANAKSAKLVADAQKLGIIPRGEKSRN